jgi:putative oxidoreductase
MVPIGRLLFTAIFIASTPGHFAQGTVAYAAAHGVPFPSVLVPLSGLLALAGTLSIVLGFRARIGALLLLLFLIPVSLMMHDFWNLTDPQMQMQHRIQFMKNVSLMGGTLLIAYFGAGPLSLDARAGRAGP